MIKITVTGLKNGTKEFSFDKKIKAEDLLNIIKKDYEFAYPIFACKVNNAYRALTHYLYHDSKVEFLDIRNSAAWLIYQNGLIMLYKKAIHDVIDKNRLVTISHSLNKGIYTLIKPAIDDDEIVKIEDRMHELVKMNLPIIKEHLTSKETLKLAQQQKLNETIRLVKTIPNENNIEVYSLQDEVAIFNGLMVPSTSYLINFELVKYKNGILLRYPHPNNPLVIPDLEDAELMFETYKESDLWGKLLGIKYVADLNEKVINNQIEDVFLLQEALHEKRISDIADEIKTKGRKVVLICGPSSSGKTTFAKRLCIQLMVNGLDTLYLGTDDYFVEKNEKPLDENGEPDLESIRAVDTKLLISNIQDLLAGKEVDLPIFDFKENTKIFGTRISSLKENQLIVIEGIHALNDILTNGIPEEEKYKIYISPLTPIGIDHHNRISVTDARMLRRLVRDHQFRGRSAEDVLREWVKVRKSEDVNIFPFNNKADAFFNSNCIYELAVLKKYAEPLLKEIDRSSSYYAEANRMLDFLKYIVPVKDDNNILNNSIMREFIGGSIIVK